jgi:hypothetical protein
LLGLDPSLLATVHLAAVSVSHVGGTPATAAVHVRVKRFLRHNGLTLTLLALFALTLFGGQLVSGLKVYNEERRFHGQAPVTASDYLRSAHFAEATTENWESEFFQMGLFVTLTVFLYQKGSAESNDPDAPAAEKSRRVDRRSPWPVRQGGVWLRLYQHSLSTALLLFFLVSFAGHAWSGTRLENEERAFRGQPAQTIREFMGSSQFWFQSFQNWQSEFLSIAVMVVFTVFLREKGSPESKEVATPDREHD